MFPSTVQGDGGKTGFPGEKGEKVELCVACPALFMHVHITGMTETRSEFIFRLESMRKVLL